MNTMIVNGLKTSWLAVGALSLWAFQGAAAGPAARVVAFPEGSAETNEYDTIAAAISAVRSVADETNRVWVVQLMEDGRAETVELDGDVRVLMDLNGCTLRPTPGAGGDCVIRANNLADEAGAAIFGGTLDGSVSIGEGRGDCHGVLSLNVRLTGDVRVGMGNVLFLPDFIGDFPNDYTVDSTRSNLLIAATGAKFAHDQSSRVLCLNGGWGDRDGDGYIEIYKPLEDGVREVSPDEEEPNAVGPLASAAAGAVVSAGPTLTGSDWMREMPDHLRLVDLMMPASHDAGMCRNWTDNEWTVWYVEKTNWHPFGFMKEWIATQYVYILGQAEMGVRYFDVRPRWSSLNNAWAASHRHNDFGGDGETLKNIFDGLRYFLSRHQRETVIVRLSHWESDSDKANVLKWIYAGYRDWLFKSDSDICLNEIRLGDGVRGKIVLVCDDCVGIFSRQVGSWGYCEDGKKANYLNVYDDYSDSGDVDRMRVDQLDKLAAWRKRTNSDPSAQAFELSWTLTWQYPFKEAVEAFSAFKDLTKKSKNFWEKLVSFFEGVGAVFKSIAKTIPAVSSDNYIVNMAARANAQLDTYLSDGPTFVNLDYVTQTVANVVIKHNYRYTYPTVVIDPTEDFRSVIEANMVDKGGRIRSCKLMAGDVELAWPGKGKTVRSPYLPPPTRICVRYVLDDGSVEDYPLVTTDWSCREQVRSLSRYDTPMALLELRVTPDAAAELQTGMTTPDGKIKSFRVMAGKNEVLGTFDAKWGLVYSRLVTSGDVFAETVLETPTGDLVCRLPLGEVGARQTDGPRKINLYTPVIGKSLIVTREPVCEVTDADGTRRSVGLGAGTAVMYMPPIRNLEAGGRYLCPSRSVKDVSVNADAQLILLRDAELHVDGGITLAPDAVLRVNAESGVGSVGLLRADGIANSAAGGSLVIDGGRVSIGNRGICGESLSVAVLNGDVKSCATIGGDGSEVRITGGKVVARAEMSGFAIGGAGASIVIGGGSVTAGGVAGGIGGPAANVRISGGTVNASAVWQSDVRGSMGIGTSSGGSILIEGGMTTASGGDCGAAIGLIDEDASPCTLEIKGGRNTLIGGRSLFMTRPRGRGIGGPGFNVSISGGTTEVQATEDVSVGTLTVSGGSLIASDPHTAGNAVVGADGRTLHCVRVSLPGVPDSESVGLNGTLAGYGDADMYPVDGEVWLWLPDAFHVFKLGGSFCAAPVEGLDIRIVAGLKTGLYVDGVEVGSGGFSGPGWRLDSGVIKILPGADCTLSGMVTGIVSKVEVTGDCTLVLSNLTSVLSSGPNIRVDDGVGMLLLTDGCSSFLVSNGDAPALSIGEGATVTNAQYASTGTNVILYASSDGASAIAGPGAFHVVSGNVVAQSGEAAIGAKLSFGEGYTANAPEFYSDRPVVVLAKTCQLYLPKEIENLTYEVFDGDVAVTGTVLGQQRVFAFDAGSAVSVVFHPADGFRIEGNERLDIPDIAFDYIPSERELPMARKVVEVCLPVETDGVGFVVSNSVGEVSCTDIVSSGGTQYRRYFVDQDEAFSVSFSPLCPEDALYHFDGDEGVYRRRASDRFDEASASGWRYRFTPFGEENSNRRLPIARPRAFVYRAYENGVVTEHSVSNVQFVTEWVRELGNAWYVCEGAWTIGTYDDIALRVTGDAGLLLLDDSILTAHQLCVDGGTLTVCSQADGEDGAATGRLRVSAHNGQTLVQAKDGGRYVLEGGLIELDGSPGAGWSVLPVGAFELRGGTAVATSPGDIPQFINLPVTVVGGSFVAPKDIFKGTITDRSGADVFPVRIRLPSSFPRTAPVVLEGLEGYGANDIWSRDGVVTLWLPNGEYLFRLNGRICSVTMAGAEVLADTGRATGVTVDGVDVGIGECSGAGWSYDERSGVLSLTPAADCEPVLSGRSNGGVQQVFIASDATVRVRDLSVDSTGPVPLALGEDISVVLRLEGESVSFDARSGQSAADIPESSDLALIGPARSYSSPTSTDDVEVRFSSTGDSIAVDAHFMGTFSVGDCCHLTIRGGSQSVAACLMRPEGCATVFKAGDGSGDLRRVDNPGDYPVLEACSGVFLTIPSEPGVRPFVVSNGGERVEGEWTHDAFGDTYRAMIERGQPAIVTCDIESEYPVAGNPFSVDCSAGDVELSGADFPKEVRLCEYIQSDGGQWLDTKCVHTPSSRIVCEVEVPAEQPKSTAAVFGSHCLTFSGPEAFGFYVRRDGVLKPAYERGSGVFDGNQESFPYGRRTKLACGGMKAEWLTGSVSATGETVGCCCHLLVFNENGSTSPSVVIPENFGAKMKLYGFSIYESGRLVADLVPCYEVGGLDGGLYDLLSGDYLRNRGNGPFAHGEYVTLCEVLGCEHQRVGWIDSASVQTNWVDGARFTLPRDCGEVTLVFEADSGYVFTDVSSMKVDPLQAWRIEVQAPALKCVPFDCLLGADAVGWSSRLGGFLFSGMSEIRSRWPIESDLVLEPKANVSVAEGGVAGKVRVVNGPYELTQYMKGISTDPDESGRVSLNPQLDETNEDVLNSVNIRSFVYPGGHAAGGGVIELKDTIPGLWYMLNGADNALMMQSETEQAQMATNETVRLQVRSSNAPARFYRTSVGEEKVGLQACLWDD